MSEVPTVAKKIIANVEKVVVGKRQEVILPLVAFYCEGHILLEDVPGVAKTMLARALAGSVGCSFKRVQCTPDLLPNDITGVSIFNPKSTEFEFRPGPLFGQQFTPDKKKNQQPSLEEIAMRWNQKNVDLQSSEYLNQFEKPAYLRAGLNLDEKNQKRNNISRLSIDENFQFRDNNSFLFDQCD